MPDTRQNGALILIVDDEPSARSVLEGLLAFDKYATVTAADGFEALEALKAHSPDLILLDVMMPGINGYDVCRAIRSDARIREIPIILITALDDQESRLRGIEAGADDFITKPYDSLELRYRVRSITRLNRYRRLHDERAKFEWVVANAEKGYLVLDGHDRVTYANTSARAMLQIPDPAAGPLPATFSETVRASFRCLSPEAWVNWPEPPPNEKACPRYLVRPETPSSPPLWLKIETLELSSANSRACLVRVNDISDQMKLQQDIWRFHTVVSHKLRSPLAGFKGSMEFLAQDVAELPREEIEDFAKMASVSAQRLLNVVQDVLEFCGAPKLAAAGSGFTLGDLARQSAETAERLGLQNVRAVIPAELAGRKVQLSPPSVELILIELFENAKRFHPLHSPAIVVEVAPARNDSSRLIVRVTDDGVTLHPQQLARVWIPYYQCEKVFTGEVDGSGLGLPMIASMVWSVGGNCRIQNNEGRPGITVELELSAGA